MRCQNCGTPLIDQLGGGVQYRAAAPMDVDDEFAQEHVLLTSTATCESCGTFNLEEDYLDYEYEYEYDEQRKQSRGTLSRN